MNPVRWGCELAGYKTITRVTCGNVHGVLRFCICVAHFWRDVCLFFCENYAPVQVFLVGWLTSAPTDSVASRKILPTHSRTVLHFRLTETVAAVPRGRFRWRGQGRTVTPRKPTIWTMATPGRGRVRGGRVVGREGARLLRRWRWRRATGRRGRGLRASKRPWWVQGGDT